MAKDDLFYELLNELESELSFSDSVDNKIEALSSMRSRYEAQVENIQARIEHLTEQERPASDFTYEKALNQALRTAPDILAREARIAVQINREFSAPLFINNLVKAIRTPGTIHGYLQGNRAFIDINLDSTAGNIEQWANAIKAVRAELKSSASENKPFHGSQPIYNPLASYMWAEKYYKPAREGGDIPGKKKKDKAKYIYKYWWTMNRRLEIAGSPAPWWEILDRGMAAAADSFTDAEGFPYPLNSPTGFVSKAREKILARYNELATQVREEISFESDKTNLRQEIVALRKLLAEIERKLIELTDSLGNIYTTPDEGSFKAAFYTSLDYVSKNLDVAKQKITRLDEIAKFWGISSEKELLARKEDILSGKRITLSTGQRIRTEELRQQLIEYGFGEY